VLFSFPATGKEKGKLIAELISEPTPSAKQTPPRGRNAHEAEIQILEGGTKGQLVPKGIAYRATVRIDVPGQPGVTKSASFDAHVPKIAQLAAKANLPQGNPDSDYIRNTIIVNRGLIRVKDVVVWDAGGFPLTGNLGDIASSPAEVSFMACNTGGHAANECVLEVPDPDVDSVVISGTDPALNGTFKSVRRPSHRTQENTLELRISNYEFQRAYPVPWGLDFQWLFARAGYGPIILPAGELGNFIAFGTNYDKARGGKLFADDRATLLPANEGRPFPYLKLANPLTVLKPLTEIESRPVCVPGEGQTIL
jgi:hypothetical protein